MTTAVDRRELLRARLAPYVEAELETRASDQLLTYLDLLLKWNRTFSLTAVRDEGSIVAQHFGESLFCARHIGMHSGMLLDFGSGAGFPGIPIQIARPDLHVTLLEAQQKKAAFLREVVRELSLPTRVLAVRGESVTERFGSVVLRAVEEMHLAVSVAQGLVNSPGELAVMTTKADTDKVKASVDGVSWRPAIDIPGSEHKILLIGDKPAAISLREPEANSRLSVPRGTSRNSYRST